MAKQDFAVGLLQGLYNGGVGNPQVNAEMRQNALQEAFTKQKMDIQAQENGMTPDVHPETHNIIKSILFPGLGDSFQGYKPDPNASVYSQDTKGNATLGPRSSMAPGSVMLDKEKGASLLASQEQKAPDTMLVYDKNNQRPRIESLDYVQKPGEMATKTTLGDALTKIGTFAANESRGGFYGAKGSQIFMNELPSNTSPSEPAGAAYAVKVAVRQGQSLINKAGSPQAIALAASDLARAVQRSAPQMDVIRGGGFSDNLITRLNMIKQKFTADPSGTVADVPKVRKEMFDMLADLDKSAQPWIDNKLKDIESNFSDQLPSDWNAIKKRQRGETLTPIQFTGGSEYEQDKQDAAMAISKGLVTAQEAARRLRAKYPNQ